MMVGNAVDLLSKSPCISLMDTKKMSGGEYPCPCGYFSDPQKAYTCATAVFPKGQKRRLVLAEIEMIFMCTFPESIMKTKRNNSSYNKAHRMGMVACFYRTQPLMKRTVSDLLRIIKTEYLICAANVDETD